MATIVMPWFADRYHVGADWRAIAWWIHDHLPYSELQFFPKLSAFTSGDTRVRSAGSTALSLRVTAWGRPKVRRTPAGGGEFEPLSPVSHKLGVTLFRGVVSLALSAPRGVLLRPKTSPA